MRWGCGATLSVAEGYSTLCQVVRRQLERDLVASEYANAIPPQTPCQMGEDHAIMLQLNTEKTAGEFFKNRTGYFNAVFFAHKPPNSGIGGPGGCFHAGPPNDHAAVVTLVACKPFGPVVTSNSTRAPSSRVRYPCV